MTDSFEFSMKLAGREWKRQFYTSVVRSLVKTITEPVTNSDTSYKRHHDIPDASRIVEKALAFKRGDRFDLGVARMELVGKYPQREILINIYTAQGHGRKSRTCEVVDYAEGLSREELISVFKEFAADKSDVSKGRPGRSLFGRGVCDVLLGHPPSTFFSYKNGVLSTAEFSFDPLKDDAPRVKVSEDSSPKASDLKELHLRHGQNGSCVRFTLHEDCRIPDEGTLLQALSQFYMLRLIHSDPNIQVSISRHRSGGKVLTDRLEYGFPIGDVIGAFSSSFSSGIADLKHKPIIIDAVVCRADEKVGLPGRNAGDHRANGLLFVDDKDAVLDLTFTPKFENAPYLANIYGIVRLTNIRDVFTWFLNNGKDSPLTVTRDGLDLKHEFTKLLYKELLPHLEPIFKKEEERFNKSHVSEVSTETRKKINDALKELNKFLKEIGEGEGDETETTHVKPDKDIQFIPQNTKLTVGRDRGIKLFVRKSLVKKGSTTVYDSSNSAIEVSPMSHDARKGILAGEYLVFYISARSAVLHATGRITALVDSLNGLLEARLEVLDVLAEKILVPPIDMEFRPRESRGRPGSENSIALLINPAVIPVGRKIKLAIMKAHGAIGMYDRPSQRILYEGSRIFEKSSLMPGYNIGRLTIPWRGTGWGQTARIVAETKRPDGTTVHAEARIVIEQSDELAGVIKDVKYVELEDQRRSDLVDGIIYINSGHYLNKEAFGTTEDYKKRLESDRTAQYKFSEIIVEQSVYRLAEDKYTRGTFSMSPDAPVTSMRMFIDEKTHELAPKIARILITK